MHSRTAIGPTLVPLHGPGERQPRTLDRDVATVGRARGCDVILDASDVSTIHCVLFRAADGYYVRDCNSRTGTRVNGSVIRGTPLLHDGDILQVGPFSFELKIAGSLIGTAPSSPAQVRHWQESRRTLAGHALRLRRVLREREAELLHETARLREKIQSYDRRRAELEEADQELDAERAAFRVHAEKMEKELAGRQEAAGQQVTDRERQEFDAMKQQLEHGQAEAHAAFEKQRAALAQQESALKTQRTDLARMMGELRQLQDELRRPHKAELQALADENERLRLAVTDYAARLAQPSDAAPGQALDDARAETELLRELLEQRERQLAEAHEQLDAAALAGKGEAAGELEPLRAENDLLKQLLAEKDSLVDELRIKAAPKPAKAASELERYESELNEYRQQLEGDKAKLARELEQLRVRNQELDDATREMEMEMSRERAEMGRERIRMERMRDELKTDMDKMQREMSVRESLAPVQRLREEMAQKKPGGSNPGERLRTLRSNGDTPR